MARCCARAISGNDAAPPISVMNSRRLIATPETEDSYRSGSNLHRGAPTRSALPLRANRCGALGHVRFGSKADSCSAAMHVRFTPNSDRKSRHPQTIMSALPPKADMCSAHTHVCYGPIADIVTRSHHRPEEALHVER